jgi:hypothetical protein
VEEICSSETSVKSSDAISQEIVLFIATGVRTSHVLFMFYFAHCNAELTSHVAQNRLLFLSTLDIKWSNTFVNELAPKNFEIGLLTYAMYATGARAVIRWTLALYSGRVDVSTKNMVVPIE